MPIGTLFVRHAPWGTFATYSVLVLYKALVVATDRDQEEQAVNILKAMNPLLAFRSLSTNIKHAVSQLPEVENGFCYTRSS